MERHFIVAVLGLHLDTLWNAWLFLHLDVLLVISKGRFFHWSISIAGSGCQRVIRYIRVARPRRAKRRQSRWPAF